MLIAIRVFSIFILSSSLTAESVPIQVPAKPILIPRQGITPRPTQGITPKPTQGITSRPKLTPEPAGSSFKQVLPYRSSSLLRPTSSYTLALGPEVVKGVCVSTVTETETEWLVFRKQSNILRYADGRRERSIILHVRETTDGSQLLQTSQIEASLKQCLTPQTASDEEALRSQLNVCLKTLGNSVEVSYLTTSVGELQCPTQPAEQRHRPSK